MKDTFRSMTTSGGSVANQFRYTARELDTETSLYYYRARYYDPTPGRFLSEDPIGFNGGTNSYAYVYNDPANFADPFGLRKYKCNFAGVCSKYPFGPRRNRPTSPPKPQPCPLIKKAYDDFDKCANEGMLDDFPGEMNKAGMKQASGVQLPPPNSNVEPAVPGVGLGDALDALGSSTASAIKKCLKQYPLAALDPRFPQVFNAGKIFAPNWFDAMTDYLGWSSPIF